MRNQIIALAIVGLTSVFALHIEVGLEYIHDRLNEQKEFFDNHLQNKLESLGYQE